MQNLPSRPAVDHLAQPWQVDLLLPRIVIEKTLLIMHKMPGSIKASSKLDDFTAWLQT